jgi:hypothetical protein
MVGINEKEMHKELREIRLRNLHDVYGYDIQRIAEESFRAGYAQSLTDSGVVRRSSISPELIRALPSESDCRWGIPDNVPPLKG